MPGEFFVSGPNSQRWMNIFNNTDETMPPHACAQWYNYDQLTSRGIGTFIESHQGDPRLMWSVEKPGEAMERDQAGFALILNGPEPIPPKSPGMGTRDWPTLAIHEYRSTALGGGTNNLGVGSPCGPKKGSWSLHKNGSAFRCIGHSMLENVGSSVWTMWVQGPEVPDLTPWVTVGAGTDQITVEAGKTFSPAMSGGFSKTLLMNAVEQNNEKKYELLRGVDRLYASFAGTVWDASTTEDVDLKVSILHLRKSTVQRRFTGMRQQTYQDDVDSQIVKTARGQIVVFGIFDNAVEKGDFIALKNDGSTTITISHANFTAYTLAERPIFAYEQNRGGF